MGSEAPVALCLLTSSKESVRLRWDMARHRGVVLVSIYSRAALELAQPGGVLF